jgi:hypothetical protein
VMSDEVILRFIALPIEFEGIALLLPTDFR